MLALNSCPFVACGMIGISCQFFTGVPRGLKYWDMFASRPMEPTMATSVAVSGSSVAVVEAGVDVPDGIGRGVSVAVETGVAVNVGEDRIVFCAVGVETTVNDVGLDWTDALHAEETYTSPTSTSKYFRIWNMAFLSEPFLP
jgi:hypothetical protein